MNIFIKRSLRLLPFLLAASFLLSFVPRKKAAREFYQLTVYRFSSETQEKLLDQYIGEALIPALHRLNVKSVGVFKSISNDTAVTKALYVLTPMRSLDFLSKLPAKLAADLDYQSKAKAYNQAPYTAPAYTRMETVVLQAFALAPQMKLPALKSDRKDRVYELRSYESASESIFQNKVRMFNEGDEIGLFARLNFNAVFYGEVIAGSKMPNLMYMTSFESLTDRDAHWKAFSADSAWKKLSSLPEYQHNVSHIDIMMLRPTAYSDY